MAPVLPPLPTLKTPIEYSVDPQDLPGISDMDNIVYVDDGEDIQDAIDAATAGQTVLIGPGTYVLTAADVLTAKANVKIQGHGCGGDELDPTGGATIITLDEAGTILTVNAANFECERIRFVVGTLTTAKLPEIQAGGDNCIFRDCHFESTVDSSTPALYISGVADPVLFESCSFRAAYTLRNTVVVSGAAVVTWDLCRMMQGYIYLAAGTHTFENCTAVEGNHYGLYLNGSTVTARGCNFSGTYGLWAVLGADLTLVSCTCTGISRALHGSGVTIEASNCSFTGGAFGVNTLGSTSFTGHNCAIYGTTAAVNPEGDNTALYGCTLTSPSGDGVRPHTGDEILLFGCDIDVGSEGLRFDDIPAATSAVEGCTIRGATADVYVATGLAVDLATFKNNTLSNTGIVLAGTGTFTCAANTTKYVGGGVDCYQTIQGAIDCCQAGDTVEIAPGTYALTAATVLTAAASVKLRGAGCGGEESTATGGATIITLDEAGTILTVNAANFECERIRFAVGTIVTAKLPEIQSGGDGCVFRDCYFQHTLANCGAFWVSGAGITINVDNCSFEGMIKNAAIVDADNSMGYWNNCSITLGYFFSNGGWQYITNLQTKDSSYGIRCQSGYTYLEDSVLRSSESAAADCGAYIVGTYLSAKNCSFHGGSGVRIFAGNVHFDTCTLTGVQVAGHGLCFDNGLGSSSTFKNCTIRGALADIYIKDTKSIDVAEFKNNTLPSTGIVLQGTGTFTCAANTVKYVGGGIDCYQTPTMAAACVAADDTILVHPGTYSITAAIDPVASCTFRGVGRREDIIISRGAGNAAFDPTAGNRLTLENLSVVGSLDVDGNGTALIVYDCDLTGMIDVLGGDATTVITLDGVTINGDTSDHYALRLADADPLIYCKRSYMKADGANPAIYYAAVNNNLKIAHCTVMHGSLGANNPLGTAAGNPNFYSHHSAWNSDPEAGAAFSNLVPVGQRFDALDPSADY